MTKIGTTRDALLRAARELFAQQGFDTTSVRQITAQAGANLGAITYHFQSKENLYLQVLESMAEPLYARVAAAVEVSGSPLDKIESFVRAYFEHLLANRELPSLILHEVSLDHPISLPIRSMIERISRLLAGVIINGQKDGTLAAGDVGLMSMSVVALPVHAVVVRRVAHQIFGRNLNEPAAQAEVTAHITAFLRRGLGNPGRNT